MMTIVVVIMMQRNATFLILSPVRKGDVSFLPLTFIKWVEINHPVTHHNSVPILLLLLKMRRGGEQVETRSSFNQRDAGDDEVDEKCQSVIINEARQRSSTDSFELIFCPPPSTESQCVPRIQLLFIGTSGWWIHLQFFLCLTFFCFSFFSLTCIESSKTE